MPNFIPQGTGYVSGPLGAGTIATNQPYVVNTDHAGDVTPFGVAVTKSGNVIAPAVDGKNVYGVTLNRYYIQSWDSRDTEQWDAKDEIPVMRSGAVAVQISADVKAGDPATVGAGGVFKTAADGDTVVGQFLDDGKFNASSVSSTDFGQVSTAPVQLNLGGAYATTTPASK
ncbi:MAG: hypothetical protein SOH70_03880 [Lentilactobacillus sunkii]|jgi:hypothetical protein|uniref:structural cement protein Gp24 n=1 Tax=Lentilactobacillus sunkii TaxID=481719 RepID=UPI002F350FDE